MQTVSRRIAEGLGGFLLLAALSATTSSATPIVYSWTGFLAPVGERDPLGLGSELTPYTMEATIPGLSAPPLSGQAGFAAFDLSGFRLVIDGQEPFTLVVGSIHFTDRQSAFGGIEAHALDNISVVAEVSYARANWVFSSIVPLPHDAFFFPTETSLPPVFSPLAAVDGGSSSLSLPNSLGGYDLIYWDIGQAPRVTSTLVPEPATLLLALTCLALHLGHPPRR